VSKPEGGGGRSIEQKDHLQSKETGEIEVGPRATGARGGGGSRWQKDVGEIKTRAAKDAKKEKRGNSPKKQQTNTT